MKNKKEALGGMTEKGRRTQRYFSEEARKSIVFDLDANRTTVAEVCRQYEVSKSAVYKWLAAYSPLSQKNLAQAEDYQSVRQRRIELEKKVAELKKLLIKQEVEAAYLHELINIASSELGIDLIKNFGAESSEDATKNLKKT